MSAARSSDERPASMSFDLIFAEAREKSRERTLIEDSKAVDMLVSHARPRSIAVQPDSKAGARPGTRVNVVLPADGWVGHTAVTAQTTASCGPL